MQPSLYTNSFVQFLLFAFGALLALALNGKTFVVNTLMRIVLFFVGVGLWLVAEGGLRIFWADRISPLAITSGFVLAAVGCVAIFLSFSGATSRIFPKPIIYLGKISYGLYVFHMGAMLFLQHVAPKLPHDYFVRWALTLGLTIIVAGISYRFLEMPF